MTEPGTMVDVVGAESGAEQSLQEIVLFVGAFGALKDGHRVGAPLPVYPVQLLGRQLQCLIPGGRAEGVVPVGWRGRSIANIGGRSLQQGHVAQSLALR